VLGLTWVDWIFVVLLASATLGGLARGFFRSLFGLGGLIVGLILAAWNYWRVAEWLRPAVHSDAAANTIGFVLIALAVMLAAALAGGMMAKAMEKIGLGCLDRLAGALFGLFQGALLATLVVWVTIAFFPSAEWLTHSRLPRYFFGACHFSARLSPESLGSKVRKELLTVEKQSEEWMHPEKKQDELK